MQPTMTGIRHFTKAVHFEPSSDKMHLLTEILQLLFESGAHHDFVNNDDKTAMH